MLPGAPAPPLMDRGTLVSEERAMVSRLVTWLSRLPMMRGWLAHLLVIEDDHYSLGASLRHLHPLADEPLGDPQ